MKDIKHSLVFLAMHIATMATILLMSKLKVDDRLIAMVVGGWFGFLSADKMRKDYQSPSLISTPIPTTRPLDRR